MFLNQHAYTTASLICMVQLVEISVKQYSLKIATIGIDSYQLQYH